MRVILLTGLPGTGKTTMVKRIHEQYSRSGVRVGGIITSEVRGASGRIGFKLLDLSNGREGWLARKDSGVGPRVGLYRVVTEDLETIGVAALNRAVDGPADLVLVDEVGPMEMTSPSFREAVSRVLKSIKTILATVKYGSHYGEIEEIRDGSVQLEITKTNREEIYNRLVRQIDEWIRPRG